MKYLFWTWQLTWIGVMITSIFASYNVLDYDYGNWLFVLGIVNIAVTILFWLIAQNRVWIIINIWIAFNLFNSGIGIYFFTNYFFSESFDEMHSIIFFVYLGFVVGNTLIFSIYKKEILK